MRLSKKHLDKSGATLSEVCISLAVTSVGWVATCNYMGYSTNVTIDNDAISTRDELVLLLNKYVHSPAAMTQTLQLNPSGNLQTCIIASSQSPANCLHAVTTPFSIYDPSGRRFSGPGAVGQSLAQPQMLNMQGIPCTAGSPNCLIQLSTSATPSCHPGYLSSFPSSPPSCPVAEFVEIDYTINALPNPATGQIYFPTKTGAIYVNLEDLNFYGQTL